MRFLHAVIIGLALIAGFLVLLPQICPGFPNPEITGTRISPGLIHGDGVQEINVYISLKNKGSGGYIVLTGTAVNETNGRLLGTTSKTVYLKQGELSTVFLAIDAQGGGRYTVSVSAKPRGSKV